MLQRHLLTRPVHQLLSICINAQPAAAPIPFFLVCNIRCSKSEGQSNHELCYSARLLPQLLALLTHA